MRCENYCQNCDAVVHTDVDEDAFYNFKTGQIRCPDCGSIIKPCNECLDEHGHHHDCSKCPYENAEIVNAIPTNIGHVDMG